MVILGAAAVEVVTVLSGVVTHRQFPPSYVSRLVLRTLGLLFISGPLGVILSRQLWTALLMGVALPLVLRLLVIRLSEARQTSAVGQIVEGKLDKTFFCAAVAVACAGSIEEFNVLTLALLGCAAWATCDVLLSSRRLRNGQYGDAAFELRSLVAPLVARGGGGTDPKPPNQVIPEGNKDEDERDWQLRASA